MGVRDHSAKEKGTQRGSLGSFCAVFLVLLFLLCTPSQARAAWLIDPQAFHASVHGRTSCQDCHGDILKKTLHPDPGTIAENSPKVFEPEQCFACHDDVQDKLSKNLHGGRQVQDGESFSDCLTCHDPHGQMVRVEKPGFDPSMTGQMQCGACHESRTDLPPLSQEDQACMRCHGAAAAGDPGETAQINGVCLHCHAEGDSPTQRLTGAKIPLIRLQEYEKTPHAALSCIACHPESTGFNHGGQESGECGRCHGPHPEKVAHDAHVGVSCEACHLPGVRPIKDNEFQDILWTTERKPGEISRVHAMALQEGNQAVCRRCHTAGNQVGAPAMVLPAKGVLCMPCHTSTFSANDTTTVLGMMVFFAGMVLFFAPALTGSQGRGQSGPWLRFLLLVWDGVKAVFSWRIFRIVKALFLDVLLQRRLFRTSRYRWLIHGLIFYPFVIRFLWGIIGLVGSVQGSESEWIWGMLDKNEPLTAFVFDATGILLFVGLALAFVRGGRNKVREIPGVAGQDRIALVLIAGIVAVGFFLEGMRIAMTGTPEGSQYSFLGYALSRMFQSGSSTLTGFYGYVWYAHAVLTGAFVAYLPFSRLLHVIIAPWVLAMNDSKK